MNKDIYIHRKIEEILSTRLQRFSAVALTGPRQSGKSTLLKNMFSDDYTVISFDDPLARERAFSDPKLFMETAGEKVIFDEIQYAPKILSYIKILIDRYRGERGKFILTGSQQFGLIKNIGDKLAGRVALLDLLPFSIEEKRFVPALADQLSSAEDCFAHSSLQGSFPEVNVHLDMDSTAWYGSYIQTYLERDIRTIYNVGILREFQQFLRL